MGPEADSTEVILTPEVIEKSVNDFNDIVDQQSVFYDGLVKCDQELYDIWEGTAGDTFMQAAYTLETKFSNVITRHENAAKALSDAKQNFYDSDNAAKDDIETNSKEGSTGSSGSGG